MCGIVGSNYHSLAEIEQALFLIKGRGPDATKIENINNVFFGANRLSIQDSSSQYHQPLLDQNLMLNYNGELWNGYSSSYTNDTQFIFDQFKEKKYNLFAELDGMFALALYYENKIILARDILGEIPLYYYHNQEKFCYASEIKSLIIMEPTIPKKEIKLLPPATYLIFENNTITLHKYYDLPYLTIQEEQSDIVQSLRTTLIQATLKRIPQVPYTLLLSGGIDSSIIAYILSCHNPQIEAFTIHLGELNKKTNYNDLYWARKVAQHLKITLHEIIITEEDVLNHLEEAVWITEDNKWTQISSAIPHLIMAKTLKKHGFKVVFSGSASDELFASYPIERRWCYNSDQDYDNARRKLISKLHSNNLIRENKILLSQGIEPRSPFTQKEFIEYAINIPPQYRLLEKRMKPLLRYAFQSDFPNDILMREKITEGKGVGLEDLIKAKKTEIKSIYERYFV